DGVADIAVFDSNTGYWYIRTVSGTTLGWQVAWGWPGAVPVPGDYNGDGISDLAVFDSNTGFWYIRTMSGTTLAWAVAWGWPGAIPVGSLESYY
ncbi:MAG: VCBS repeat-containing protein, partial [Lentisphaerae bacterium]|nr:VCBS repeat-containing protein [Lentisphaerota bacterium]